MTQYTDPEWLTWIDELSENDFTVIDNFLPPSTAELVSTFFNQHLEKDDFARAGIGSSGEYQIKSTIRGDHIYWISKDRDEKLKPVFELLDELVAVLNRYCFLSLSGYEFHLAYYPEGTFYKRHIDQFRDRNNRMISVIIYLNENWQEGDGGELRIFREKSEDIDIQPLYNRCVLFRSDIIEHEVLLTHKGRYSLTGWLLYQPAGLGQLLG